MLNVALPLVFGLAVLAPHLVDAVRSTRRAVGLPAWRTCTRPGQLDRLLAKNRSADWHLSAAMTLKSLGHHDYAKLHLDIAERRLIEERLGDEERRWHRDHPPVRALVRVLA